ncbi:MAG TPA: hypothetical protein HPP94_16285 [Desulfuromonadales bacterium]|nr:hypothetical protein [Desulfuromonadales bacterium]
MVTLVNLPDGPKLLDVIAETVVNTAKPGKKKSLYIISCYFDIDTILEVVKCVKSKMDEHKEILQRVKIIVDIGDFIKSRQKIDKIKQIISDVAGNDLEKVYFKPIYVSGQLLHAKSYALIGGVNKKTQERSGFTAVTSGNLTQRGMGIDRKNNVEIVQIDTNSSNIINFRDSFYKLNVNYSVPSDRLQQQDDFLLALTIFSEGCFYHKWDGALSSEIRIALNLTEKGKRERDKINLAFGNLFKPDKDTLSYTPIDLKRLFEDTPKPFNKSFWKINSVETLVGRWVPHNIASTVDQVLSESIAPYIVKLRELTSKNNLDRMFNELAVEISEMKRKRYIKEDVSCLQNWRNKVAELPDRQDLLQLRILPYEKVPDLLDSIDRQLIIRIFLRLKSQIAISKRQPSGVRGIIARAINNGAINLSDELIRHVQLKS